MVSFPEWLERWAPAGLFRLFFNPKLDREVRLSMMRADAYQHAAPLEEEGEKRLIEFAQRKLEFSLGMIEKLAAKREETLKYASGLVAAVFVAVRGLGTTPTVEIKASVVFFLAAAAVLIWSRWARPFPGIPKIQTVREGIGGVPSPDDWMAAAYHKTCEEMKPLEWRISRDINWALAFILAGLVALIVAVCRF